MELVKKEAAILIRDDEAGDKIGKVITDLINDKNLMETLGNNIKKMAYEDSASKIADEIIKIINKQK